MSEEIKMTEEERHLKYLKLCDRYQALVESRMEVIEGMEEEKQTSNTAVALFSSITTAIKTLSGVIADERKARLDNIGLAQNVEEVLDRITEANPKLLERALEKRKGALDAIETTKT